MRMQPATEPSADSSPTTQVELQAAELARVHAETRRHQLEADEIEGRLGKRWWHLRLSVLLQACIGGVVAGGLLAAFLLDSFLKVADIIEREQAALEDKLDAQAAQFDREQAALQAQRQQIEQQLLAVSKANELLTEQLEQQKTRQETAVARLEDELKQAGTDAQQAAIARRRDALVAELGLLTEQSQVARSRSEAIESIADERIAHLLAEINHPTRQTRSSALQTLIDEYGRDPRAVDRALAMLEPPQREELRASGRINVLFFLERAQAEAWSSERVARARSAIAEMRARHEAGVALLGPQTEEATRTLEARLASLSG